MSSVHFVDWSAQGDQHVLCTNTWEETAWHEPGTDTPGVYRAESGLLYTHDPRLATCLDCEEARSASRQIASNASNPAGESIPGPTPRKVRLPGRL